MFRWIFFKVFKHDPDNARSLADNFIQNIYKDADGSFWVSSRKGEYSGTASSFSDLKYFRQCFIKEFGYQPSEYSKHADSGVEPE